MPMSISPSAMAQNTRPPSASGEKSSVFLHEYSTPAAKAQAREKIKTISGIQVQVL